MIDISKISSSYDIRRMDDSDVDSILSFCRKNTQFYEYCEAEPTREQVLGDLHITPPGITFRCSAHWWISTSREISESFEPGTKNTRQRRTKSWIGANGATAGGSR